MHRRLTLILIIAGRLWGQATETSDLALKQILTRLDSLEKQNSELVQEIRLLREQLNAAEPKATAISNQPATTEGPPIEERVAVEERRTAEQAQTKVEAAHKMPVQLNGMLLFNAFANSASPAGGEQSQYLLTGPNRDGATVRQTILGLQFQGPALPGDGRVNGFLTMDFWAGYSDPGSSWLRLRRAGVSLDWKKRSFFVGQDKPLISPYQPESLAEVGVPPLAGSGNLWLWLPQARYEERFRFAPNTGITGQVSALQTQEDYENVPPYFAKSLEQSRPALEGRLAFWHKFGDTRKIEVAPGFHVSTTHVAGASVPSHIASLDWLIVPASHFQFSGTAYKGQNVAGLGALGIGFTISPQGVHPVASSGGWAQLAFPINRRLTLNMYSGLESDSGDYLSASTFVHNWSYASNVIYRLGPNVLISFEALQMRARPVAGPTSLQNHYDLALAYLF